MSRDVVVAGDVPDGATPVSAPPTVPVAGPDLTVAVVLRRQWWLVLAALALVTALYLVGWSVYATTHTVRQYEQLAPGAAGNQGGAQFRLVSLTRTLELGSESGPQTQVAEPGTVFVVAVVEVVPQRLDGSLACTVDLLGPDERLWTSIFPQVARPRSSCLAGAEAGTPQRFETIFRVPERYAEQLRGVVLVDPGDGPSLVLRPPD